MREQLGTEHEPIKSMLKITVLISNKGTGSNLQAIIDAKEAGKLPQVQIGLVVSDKEDAKGLDRAKKHGLAWEVKEFKGDRIKYGIELASRLNTEGIKLVVLAGFATILPRSFFEVFKGPMINIHPGLLPNEDGSPFIFPDGTEAPWNKGKMTDDAVATFFKMKLKWGGSTVHIATVEADSGPVLERVFIPILSEDSVETFYSRLKLEEHQALIRALQNTRRIFEIAK